MNYGLPLAIGFPGDWSVPIAETLIYCYFIFWIAMAIDAILHETRYRIAWILTVCFIPILGAISYFFLVFARRRRLEP